MKSSEQAYKLVCEMYEINRFFYEGGIFVRTKNEEAVVKQLEIMVEAMQELKNLTEPYTDEVKQEMEEIKKRTRNQNELYNGPVEGLGDIAGSAVAAGVKCLTS